MLADGASGWEAEKVTSECVIDDSDSDNDVVGQSRTSELRIDTFVV